MGVPAEFRDSTGEVRLQGFLSSFGSIEIADTLATSAQVFGPFDVRGLSSLSLYTEVTDWTVDTSEAVNVNVLTRQEGRPWSVCGQANVTAELAAFDYFTPHNLGPSAAGGKLLSAWEVVFMPLYDEAVIIAAPQDENAVTPATVTNGSGSLVLNAFPGVGTVGFGDAGDLFSVEFVDPGAANSPLTFTSDDGWAMKVNLETDSMGTPVTTAIDVVSSIIGGPHLSSIFPDEQFDETLIAEGPLQLAGGDSGATGVTYRVTGTY